MAGNQFDTAGNKFRAIEDAMNRLNESMQLLQVQMASVGDPVGNPQHFGMGALQQQQHQQRPEHDDKPSAGQPTMGAPGFSSLYPNLKPGPTVPGTMPRYDYPQAEAQQGPTATQFPAPPIPPTGIPASCGGTQQPAMQSPFDEDAFWTPPQKPTSLCGAGDSDDFRAPHAQQQAQDGRFNAYDRSLQYAAVHPHPSSWEPS